MADSTLAGSMHRLFSRLRLSPVSFCCRNGQANIRETFRRSSSGRNTMGWGGLRNWTIVMVAMLAWVRPALAGPPYVSDDPQPTDYKHFEIYSFSNDTAARDGVGGESGIDFNYGAAPDLQLTATAAAGFDRPTAGRTSFGLSNIELAAKYRFLHQDSFVLDVSVFPRVFLPSGSSTVGNRTA